MPELSGSQPVPGDLATRTGCRLDADSRRVIAKLFVPGEETSDSRSRARAVVARVLALDEDDVDALSEMVIAGYGHRHRDLRATLAAHFGFVAHDIPDPDRLSAQRRTLLGAYFTHEFSPEAAALCNPSMAAHPDQSGLAAGQLRFVMMVRCIGEGHISSIGFRTGVIGPGSALSVDEPSRLLSTGTHRPGPYGRRVLVSRLADLGDEREEGQLLLGSLPDTFTTADLREALSQVHQHLLGRARGRRVLDHIHSIASSAYQLEFAPATSLTERLLWPTAPAESNGMEDARLVHVEEDGTYYATYVAYNGVATEVQMLATTDFRTFQISPVAGRAARSKGLALFPRRIRGRYVALSRWDRENQALAYSDDCRIWDQVDTLQAPRYGWDLIQVGNGGSPIETPRGWLVITHGVGPMREYSLGAILLDLDDPSIVVASLPTPLLTPRADERDGYVPNVVYTCGALLHDGTLTIPYGISDGAIGFAQISLADLLDRMTSDPQ
jgi:predicted GH43/DUF377 family glycosyl hydrolase